MHIDKEILIAILAFIGTMAGSYFSYNKNIAVIQEKLNALAEKVNKHNNLVEKTYQNEQNISIHEERLKNLEHNISLVEEVHRHES